MLTGECHWRQSLQSSTTPPDFSDKLNFKTKIALFIFKCLAFTSPPDLSCRCIFQPPGKPVQTEANLTWTVNLDIKFKKTTTNKLTIIHHTRHHS